MTCSVVIWPGSMPTLLKLLHHLQRHNQHRKPPAVRQISSAASAVDEQFDPMPSTSTSTTEHPYATVNFIRIVDRLFDILNSRNALAHGFKCPMCVSNENFWRPFMVQAVTYLKGLKLSNGQLITDSLRRTGIVGFVVSASSALCLFDKLLKKQQ